MGLPYLTDSLDLTGFRLIVLGFTILKMGDWEDYANRLKQKSVRQQWTDWSKLTPAQKEYLQQHFNYSPPKSQPQIPQEKTGLADRIASWPVANIIGVWMVEGVLLVFCLASFSTRDRLGWDFRAAFGFWSILLVPAILITWLWIKGREQQK